MYGIACGVVEVTPAAGPADLPIITITRAPWWFGILPVGLGAPRAVSITTRGVCVVAVVPQAALTTLLSEHPEGWQFMTGLALEHFNLASQCAADLLIPDSRRRCIAVLLRAAGRRGGDTPGSDDVGVSQNELAAMSNMSRQTTGNLLRALAAEGYLDLRYRSIVLRDAAGLQALLDA
jgi:CRP-like cAMP-binding protein